MIRSKLKTYVMLYTGYFIYSLSLVAAKLAGDYPVVSINAASLYFLAFIFLGAFAIVWQQVLKRLPLTTAYANRAITILFGMVFGAALFAERISWNMILGAVIVVCGIALMVTAHE